jgi:DNA-binding NarL/FixJ family response regulator
MGSDPDPTSNSGDDGLGVLTPLQEDIAALVAQGLSNREIAARLALAPEAVSNEITHVFRALELFTRVQIAVWAIEHGLHR